MKAHLVAAALMLALGVSAVAARAEAAASAASQLPAYHVKGFRSALFGQTDKQAVAAIEKDFGVKSADIRHLNVPSDGTSALVVNLAHMDPAPGVATVTYIFGTDGRLIHVNVVWVVAGNATGIERGEMVNAGLKLSGYFQSYAWDSRKSVLNVPLGPNSVTMFLGRDKEGGVVEVTASGVVFDRTVDGKRMQSPTPTGPVRLKVGYGSPSEGKDVTKIKSGQF
ncbi:MAG: hypothetical protein KGL29_02425 [Alphaproteobacteria bacterium]|nr:hypothetical protein [Alphaproteobacteria bacterium]